jgi:hypothetical protein
LKISTIEQNIYNCYLKALRKGQPWQPRKNFDNIDDKTAICLFKIKNFLLKFKHIPWDDYFNAYYYVYPEDKLPPLNFFTTRKAIKCYNLFKTSQENQSPDLQLDSIKDGLKFIALFCLQNNLPLENYFKHKSCSMPTWSQHYRENKVNIYSLLALDNLNEFYKLSEEEKNYWAPNLLNNLEAFKTRLHNCKSKPTILEMVARIKKFVNTELTKHKIDINIKQQTL